MQFLKDKTGFASMYSAEANYPDGFLGASGSEDPYVAVVQSANTDLLVRMRTRLLARHRAGMSRRSTVYAAGTITDGATDLDQRSSHHVDPDMGMLPAYNELDMALETLRDGMGCKTYPSMAGKGFGLNGRHQIVYEAGDHFEHHAQHYIERGFRGHSDDSVFRNMDGTHGWVRNDIRRHMVGLLWLTEGVDQVEDPDAQFSGGDIVLPFVSENGDPERPLTITPKLGLMCFFPANPLYLHFVRKITAGTRITLTGWYTFFNYR